VLVFVVIAVGCAKSHRDPPATEPARAGSSAPTRDAGEPGCLVSMLVDDSAMWIGTAAGSCRAPRHGDTLDWAWEEAELAETDVRVINTIVRTAKAAGFDNLLFAVKDR
jgi:hypothetical protein